MNWETVILAAIAAIPPTLVAAAAFYQAMKAKEQAVETHHKVDGRMDELLEITKQSAAAKATLEEKKAEKLRKAEPVTKPKKE